MEFQWILMGERVPHDFMVIGSSCCFWNMDHRPAWLAMLMFIWKGILSSCLILAKASKTYQLKTRESTTIFV